MSGTSLDDPEDFVAIRRMVLTALGLEGSMRPTVLLVEDLCESEKRRSERELHLVGTLREAQKLADYWRSKRSTLNENAGDSGAVNQKRCSSWSLQDFEATLAHDGWLSAYEAHEILSRLRSTADATPDASGHICRHESTCRMTHGPCVLLDGDRSRDASDVDAAEIMRLQVELAEARGEIATLRRNDAPRPDTSPPDVDHESYVRGWQDANRRPEAPPYREDMRRIGEALGLDPKVCDVGHILGAVDALRSDKASGSPLVRCWRCKHEVPEGTTVCNAGIGTQCKDSKACRGRWYGPHPNAAPDASKAVDVCGVPSPDGNYRCTLDVEHDGGHAWTTPNLACDRCGARNTTLKNEQTFLFCWDRRGCDERRALHRTSHTGER